MTNQSPLTGITIDFTASGPNRKWVGDITGIWTEEGWLYLAALVDLYSRAVVGWAMDAVRDEQLVENALWMDGPGASSGWRWFAPSQ